jgi:hypothetical protein
MKKPEAVMEILEAYDLTGSFRAAAGLVGCDHKTVAYWVRQRDEAGGMPVVERARPAMVAVIRDYPLGIHPAVNRKSAAEADAGGQEAPTGLAPGPAAARLRRSARGGAGG